MNTQNTIAEVDESEPYSVDRAEVWLQPDGSFVLATASGCSCWSGEWDEDMLAAELTALGDDGMT